MSEKQECPGCGDSFDKGGAYVTHVRHCDETETGANKEVGGEQTKEERIEELETQVETLQKLVFQVAEQQGKRLDHHEDRIETVENQVLDIGTEMILPLAEKIDDHSQMWSAMREWIEYQVLNDFEEATGREFDNLPEAIEYAERREKIRTAQQAIEDELPEMKGQNLVQNVADVLEEKPIRTAMAEGDRPFLEAAMDGSSDDN